MEFEVRLQARGDLECGGAGGQNVLEWPGGTELADPQRFAR